MEKGKLYGIGVGPGNPELMTLMSVRIIRESDVIFLPVSDKEKCHAYRIAKQAVQEIEEKQIVGIDFPMTKDTDILQKAYETVAEKMYKLLDEGKKIAFLTIGDVTVYSTFGYVAQIVEKRGYEVSYVNGITSFTAVSAALGLPLAEQDEEIHIIPASYEVEKSLSLNGTKVYMKSGKKLIELTDKLEELQKKEPLMVYAVANCSMDNQKTACSLSEIRNLEGYLVTVIVKNKKDSD